MDQPSVSRRREKSQEDDEARKERPSPTLAEQFKSFKKTALMMLFKTMTFCKKSYNDPFGYQIIKCTIFCALGIKLFHDIAVHLIPRFCNDCGRARYKYNCAVVTRPTRCAK